MKGVNDQGDADKVLGRELGQVFFETPDVGVDLHRQTAASSRCLALRSLSLMHLHGFWKPNAVSPLRPAKRSIPGM